VPAGAVRAQVIEALQRVGMPAEMSRRPAGGYSGGCDARPWPSQHYCSDSALHRHVC